MAYDKGLLAIETETRHHRTLSYRDAVTDDLATITGPDFFSDLYDYGVKVNDVMWVEGTDGAALHRVSAVDATTKAGTVVAL